MHITVCVYKNIYSLPLVLYTVEIFPISSIETRYKINTEVRSSVGS
jgi:hypothetical protein